MIALKILLGVFLCMGSLRVIAAKIAGQPGFQIAMNHPDKTVVVSQTVGSDDHSFGVSTKDSYHHTTTDEDGVRMGCYGHYWNGKLYSTEYVSDTRGYRTVRNHGLISVYPKSGGERKASFMRNFNEDKTIRFFFPDGCQEALTGSPSTNVETRVTPTPPIVTERSTCPKGKLVCTCSV